MDLDEWEFIPDDGFLEIHDDGGKKIFSRKFGNDTNSVFDMNYFIPPSQKSPKFVDSSEEKSRAPKQLVPVPIQLQSPVGKNPTEISIKTPSIGAMEADQDTVSQVFFKKENEFVDMKMDSPKSSSRGISIKTPSIGAMEADQDTVSQVFFKKENEFADMKMDSPKSSGRGIMPHIDSGKFQFEEKIEAIESKKEIVTKEEEEVEEREVTWGETNSGLNIWKWSLSGIGAICSFGAAAATICIIMFGSGQRNKQNHQQLRFQIYADDKRMKQVVHHATRLNEAISAVRGVPLTRAQITFGGYYDGL